MSLELFNITGKVALITGATHGLGMAMAKGLANAGATLVINGHTPSRLEDAFHNYADNGIVVHPYLFDVTDEDAVKTNIQKIEDEIGPIDILINNAGIIKRVPLEDMSVEDYQAVLEVDLVAPFIVSKWVVKSMKKRSAGKIINICSMMSELGRNTVGAYAAAKGGLKMLTRNMATEWAKYNIQVNSIAPGYFATEQTKPIRVEGHPFNEFILNRTPAGKWGDPDDLQGAAIFLSSTASDFINGHMLVVDGGIFATIGKPSNEK